MRQKILWFVFIILLSLNISIGAQEKPQVKPRPDTAKAETQKSEEEEELQKAIQSARGNQQQVLDNLEVFLKKYPASNHRDEIEQTMFKLAEEMRDKNRQIVYAERIVAADNHDLKTLTVLVSNLRERKAEGDLAKALTYSDKLIKDMEDIFATRTKPAKISPGSWEQQKARALASVYLLRGQVQSDLGNLDKSEADLLKSYKYAPLAATAALLGGIAEKRKNLDRAIDFYLQSFVRSLEASDGVERSDIRQKLGQLYIAKHGSEVGLGDKILKTFDLIVKEDAEQLAKFEPPNPNEKVTDPMQFKLTRLNGGDVKLADYKGKVVIANFWATWCGPCRVEMPELERAMAKYKDDKDVVFLAINTDDDRNYVEPYVKGQKIKLPVVYANFLDARFGISSIPTTMIFDRNGEVAFRQAGFSTSEDFVAMISEKIEAAKKK